jgi:hypothetical protein
VAAFRSLISIADSRIVVPFWPDFADLRQADQLSFRRWQTLSRRPIALLGASATLPWVNAFTVFQRSLFREFCSTKKQRIRGRVVAGKWIFSCLTTLGVKPFT